MHGVVRSARPGAAHAESGQGAPNNIGVLRLLFATLVIVGHAPEQIDGSRVREPLTLLFHTLSLGELSVDAFFLLSGYLITKSMVQTHSLYSYLERRVLRIYPGYLVAFAICVLVIGPAVGATNLFEHIPAAIGRLVFLQGPTTYPGELVGLPHRDLDGAMWTIFHEFRCYLLVAALGVLGLLTRRPFMAAATGALVILAVAATFHVVRAPLDHLDANHTLAMATGGAWSSIRLTAVFMVGAMAYLYRDQLARLVNGWTVLACFVVACCALRQPHLAEMGLATFGGIALYWLAFKAKLGPLQWINHDWDISYGVYLYGWPIAEAILYFHRTIAPWQLALSTIPLSYAAGAASWWGVEKWTKDLVRSRSTARPSASSPSTT